MIQIAVRCVSVFACCVVLAGPSPAGGASGGDIPPIPGAFVDTGAGTAPDLDFEGGATSGSGAEIEPGERAVPLMPLEVRDTDGRVVARAHRFVVEAPTGTTVVILRNDGSVAPVSWVDTNVTSDRVVALIVVLTLPGEGVPVVGFVDG